MKINCKRNENRIIKFTYTITNWLRSYLVHVISFRERIEERIHSVKHGDDLHRGDATADLRERDHVGEEDGYAVKHLCISIAIIQYRNKMREKHNGINKRK